MSSLDNLRADARKIFAAGIEGADPFAAVATVVALKDSYLCVSDRTYDLAAVRNILVLGGGKAAAPMALALQAVLGERLGGGVIVVKHRHQLDLEKITVIEAGHPIPDEAGVKGAHQVVDLARGCSEKDLLFFLASGGGSALLPYPAAGLSLEDKQKTTQALLKSGAKIQEVNAVRKHISKIKGGQLARLAAPAKLVTLVLSDVVDDSLEAIASGPTVPDSSTFADCLQIIERYDVAHVFPQVVVNFLERGACGEIPETPKPSDEVFRNVQNVIVGDNRSALAAARRCAESLGYRAEVRENAVEGESRVVAKSHAERVRKFARNTATSRPACLLSGGETTVTVRGDGLGGRNQEFSLAAAIEIDGLDDVVILSGGTDGTDGPTDAAGGIVDGTTLDRGRAKNLDAGKFLANNDSYHFLQATGDLLFTGPTLTNVMDLQITLIA